MRARLCGDECPCSRHVEAPPLHPCGLHPTCTDVWITPRIPGLLQACLRATAQRRPLLLAAAAARPSVAARASLLEGVEMAPPDPILVRGLLGVGLDCLLVRLRGTLPATTGCSAQIPSAAPECSDLLRRCLPACHPGTHLQGVSEAFKRETHPDKLNLGALGWGIRCWGRGRSPAGLLSGCTLQRRDTHTHTSLLTLTHPCSPTHAGVGAYRTEELQPYVLKVVRKAEERMLAAGENKEYLPIGAWGGRVGGCPGMWL